MLLDSTVVLASPPLHVLQRVNINIAATQALGSHPSIDKTTKRTRIVMASVLAGQVSIRLVGASEQRGGLGQALLRK